MTQLFPLRSVVRALLTIEQILSWADDFIACTGRWPSRTDGPVRLAGTTWAAVDACLKCGHRGLDPGSSLAKLLQEHRGRSHALYRPHLTIAQILVWADAHYERTRTWPRREPTPVCGVPGESWLAIDSALRDGRRGLKGGMSLARILQEHRGVRNHKNAPQLNAACILAWADAHCEHTGTWPSQTSGPILDAPGENWAAVNAALLVGVRGLPGKSSLAKLLREHRGPDGYLPQLNYKLVLAWADAHFLRTGDWPTAASGSIPEAPGKSWKAIDAALRCGIRCRGWDTLSRFLDRHRDTTGNVWRPSLSKALILAWADAHHARTDEWPTILSHHFGHEEENSWRSIDAFLRRGGRSLPAGSSLAQLLSAERGASPPDASSPLTEGLILYWADAHFARSGYWPTRKRGRVLHAPHETWSAIAAALETGDRGLPGGTSLARLLAEKRLVPNYRERPPLTIEQILAWADAYHLRTGQWPKRRYGGIDNAPGETWHAIHRALSKGLRGLPGGDSLAELLRRQRGVRKPKKSLPALPVEMIEKWVLAHKKRMGAWPKRHSGLVQWNGESWHAIDQALRQGLRGLPGGSSLSKFICDLLSRVAPTLAGTR